MKQIYMIPLFLAALLLATAAQADERLQLDQTTILGNRELPKVTFVVPWRDIEAAAPDWPLERLVDEPLTPLDREAHRLKMEQLELLKAQGGQ